MKDLNYFPLDVESNIYGMTTLEFDNRTSKVLVATHDCRIYCIIYSEFKPYTREVEFTYIPSGAKIISIGSLKRGNNDFVIGITHSLAPLHSQKGSFRSSHIVRDPLDHGRQTTYYFNIYSASGAAPFDLDQTAQNCQTIRLKFVPYHLSQAEHISLKDPNDPEGQLIKKPYWLLSGGDNICHAYCEDRLYQSFTEIPIHDCFPELCHYKGIALWVDILNILDTKPERIVALGFEDGCVRVLHSIFERQFNKFHILKESKFDEYSTIVPSVHLFRVKSTYHSKLRAAVESLGALEKPENDELNQVNLLVVSSTNTSLVFTDVLKNGLESKFKLPGSQRVDCMVTSAVADINFDGYNELVLGSHGRELMIYQYDTAENQYRLANNIELNHPIFALSILDLTGDSLKEIVVLLKSGILVMQASVRDVLAISRRRVEKILELLQ